MNKFAIIHYAMTEAVKENETANKIVEWYEQPSMKAAVYIGLSVVVVALVIFGLVKAKNKHWK